MPLSVKKFLENRSIEASAPCRIDSGGTWDIKAMALPMEQIRPVTINIALNLRVRITMTPFREGWVRISSQGFSLDETCRFSELPFNSRFGLYFAAVSYFRCHGLQVEIGSASPPKAGLGGSSAALIALIKGLSKLTAATRGEKQLSQKQILHLGYHLEDGISLGGCGMQDQAAAVFGGVNQWMWHYGDPRSPYTREALMDVGGQKEMSRHLLVAYTGKSHVSLRTNRSWISEFLSGKTRDGWLEANDVVTRLAQAMKKKKWKEAGQLLRAEMALHKKITPDSLTPVAERLITRAENLGCGARFSGAGAGGSVWAIGERELINDLRIIWGDFLRPVHGGRILDCEIEPSGVK